ncbi:transposase [Lysinibacillus fusiformis]|nr:transposase [Lysinibacillus fusiformis]
MSQKGYNQEFKEILVELYCSQIPVKEISRDYGVSKNTIYRWIKQPSLDKSSKEITFAKAESIQKENLRLRRELEILKKAIIIFARNKL